MGELTFTAKCWQKLFPEQEQMQTLQGIYRQSRDLEYYEFLNRMRYGYLEIPKDLRLLLKAAQGRGGDENRTHVFPTNKEVN